jgi:hypothetical protein
MYMYETGYRIIYLKPGPEIVSQILNLAWYGIKDMINRLEQYRKYV